MSERETTENHIRAAYISLNTEWASLTKIREMIAFIPRGEQDRALRALALDDMVRIEPQPLRHRITSADERAAIRVGGEDCHLIYMT